MHRDLKLTLTLALAPTLALTFQVHGVGFQGFDGRAPTARCLFEAHAHARTPAPALTLTLTLTANQAHGQVRHGRVLRITSGERLECEAPRAGTPLHALVKVALNGVHFVGGNPGGDASGLVYQYYHQPQLLGLTPAGGPAAGSGAEGMSQPVWAVTVHGRGFDALRSNRSYLDCAPPHGA